jgi:hypothetical protein
MQEWQDYYNQNFGGWGASAPAAAASPASSYVPGTDVSKVPGFYNPQNPYDTGRSGEQNPELARRAGLEQFEPLAGWNYDLGRPGDGFVLDQNGFYVGSGGGSGGGGGAGGAASSVFDPLLAQLKSDLAAQGVSDLASRDSAIKRAIGLFGDPNLNLGEAGKTLGFDLGAIIDPQTQQIAQQSYQSGVGTQARIDKANKDALRQIKNALAARGALRSGELGHQLKEQEGRYTNAQFDARQALLDMLSGYQKGYLEGERLRQSNYFAALMSAAGRAQYGGVGGQSGQTSSPARGNVFAQPGSDFSNFGNPNAAAGLQQLYDQQQQKKLGPLDPWARGRVSI